MHTITYKGSLLNDDDVAEIAQDFKLSYALAADAFEQLSAKGEINLSKYAGTPRERLSAFVAAITIDADQADAENSEPDAGAGPVEQPSTPVAASHPVPATVPPEDPATPLQADDTSEYEPATKTERDEVVDHAATGLMQAFSDPKGCFLISQEGVCAINPANPPSLTDSYTAVSHIMKLKELGAVVNDKSSWMFGSAVAELEDLFGEDFNLGQVCDQTEKNYNTTYQAVSVFRAFKDKRYKVSFSHHQEAFFADIPKTDLRPDPKATKRLILFKAESHGLGSKQVRALCSIAKNMEDDTVIQNIRTPQMAKDLIDTYNSAKVGYYVYSEGEWGKFNGSAHEIPEGKLVIDRKKHTVRIDGGKPIDIPNIPRPSVNVPQ